MGVSLRWFMSALMRTCRAGAAVSPAVHGAPAVIPSRQRAPAPGTQPDKVVIHTTISTQQHPCILHTIIHKPGQTRAGPRHPGAVAPRARLTCPAYSPRLAVRGRGSSVDQAHHDRVRICSSLTCSNRMSSSYRDRASSAGTEPAPVPRRVDSASRSCRSFARSDQSAPCPNMTSQTMPLR
jgi:hypothetical protein